VWSGSHNEQRTEKDGTERLYSTSSCTLFMMEESVGSITSALSLDWHLNNWMASRFEQSLIKSLEEIQFGHGPYYMIRYQENYTSTVVESHNFCDGQQQQSTIASS
jgi:hypothetical protein